jgi:hypothetical protein
VARLICKLANWAWIALADLRDDTLGAVIIRCLDDPYARFTDQLQCIGWTGIGNLDDEGRPQRQHAFCGQSPDIADIGLVLESGRREQAGRIDADDTVLQAKRIENFRHRAARSDDPFG